jgi:hypothetical protein
VTRNLRPRGRGARGTTGRGREGRRPQPVESEARANQCWGGLRSGVEPCLDSGGDPTLGERRRALVAFAGTTRPHGPAREASARRGKRRPASRNSRWGATPPERLFDTLGTIGTVGTMVPVGEGAAPSTPRDHGPDGPGRARVPQCPLFSRARARAEGPLGSSSKKVYRGVAASSRARSPSQYALWHLARTRRHLESVLQSRRSDHGRVSRCIRGLAEPSVRCAE